MDREGLSENEDPQGVTISFREIYDEIVGLRGDVRGLTQSNEHVGKKLDDHEERIRGIERWKYSVPTAVIASFVSAAVTLVKSTGG